MRILLLILLFISTLFASIGTITAAKGESTLIRNTKSLTIQPKMEINVNDLIRTSQKSKVQVILHDDTVVTIGPKSEYVFESYVDSGDVEVTMKIKHGFFKAITGKLGKIAPSRFKIRTQVATIGIRGTQFMAYVAINDEKIGCVKGLITVKTKKRDYLIDAGRMLLYKNGQWQVKKLDLKFFSPVMLGTSFVKSSSDSVVIKQDIHKSGTLQEQIIVRRSPENESLDQAYEISGTSQDTINTLPFIPQVDTTTPITPIENINMRLLPQTPINNLPYVPSGGVNNHIQEPTSVFDATTIQDNTPRPPKFRP